MPAFQTLRRRKVCSNLPDSEPDLPDQEPVLPDREPDLPNREPVLPDWNLFRPILPGRKSDNCRIVSMLEIMAVSFARFFGSFIGIIP
jgi:hypothetical protein